MPRPDLKLVLALPGLAMVAFSLAIGLALRLPFVMPELPLLVPQAATAFCLVAGLTATLEGNPSFQAASHLMEDVLGRIRLDGPWALLLSLTSSLGEELFFRWLLLGLLARFLGPLPALAIQAVLFAAMHPAPRRAWVYPLWTLAAGLVFGGVAAAAGSPLPTILAHYLFNHLNFNAALKKSPAA